MLRADVHTYIQIVGRQCQNMVGRRYQMCCVFQNILYEVQGYSNALLICAELSYCQNDVVVDRSTSSWIKVAGIMIRPHIAAARSCTQRIAKDWHVQCPDS